MNLDKMFNKLDCKIYVNKTNTEFNILYYFQIIREICYSI